MGCVGSKASPTAAHAVNLAQNDLEELPAIPIDTEKLDCSENKLKALPITIMDLVHLKELDANSNQLTAVPEGIIGCVALEKLLLYNNKIKDLPANFPPMLNELNLFNNQVRKLPASIGDLSDLEEINVASNKLMMMTDAHFASWSSVRVLNLYDNNLVRCGSLAPCVALEELRISGNSLEEMPALGVPHSKLSVIEIHKNRIKTIPDGYFHDTPHLTRLSIWGNQLVTLPASLCTCAELLAVQAQENQLSSLPTGSAYPPKLETLFVQANPLSTLPSELMACAAMRRCNVAKLDLDAKGSSVAAELRQRCMGASGGIFWDVDGVRVDAK